LRFPVYSLRTGILAQLTFLIIAAMLLINVVMVKFAERDLAQERLHAGRETFTFVKIAANLCEHFFQQRVFRLRQQDAEGRNKRNSRAQQRGDLTSEDRYFFS
jgi:hypothetical protein